VKHDPKEAWKTANKILNRKHDPQSRQISNPIELAECFNNYFTDIGPNIAKTIDY
jgi:hypothetical protein